MTIEIEIAQDDTDAIVVDMGSQGADGADGARGPGSIVKNGDETLAEKQYLKVDGVSLVATVVGDDVLLELGSVAGDATTLQGRPIDPVEPETGQVLLWTGSDWEPATLPPGGVTNVGASAPITSTGGSTPTIGVTVGTTANTVAAGNDARLVRLTARRLVTTTTSTLAVTDGILQISTGSGSHSCTLPGVAAASGMAFTLHKVNLGAQSITLVLAGGDTGAKIYFLGNSPVAGASLLLSDSVNTTQPMWTVCSDGVDWWVA